MGPANRHGHAPDPDRQRIAPEWTGMERLDQDVMVETEVTQAGGFMLAKSLPIDLGNSRARAEREFIQRKVEIGRGQLHRHCCD